MHICGIIAEYDPFHTGHAHQIRAVRELLGQDCAVICVMSGNWTQRGGASIADKHLRARLALMGGADLILELPLPCAISSAEQFAQGGVGLLHAAGIVTHLCFGSECGELAVLQQAAACLDSEAYRVALKPHLAQGVSFPTARQRAAEELIGGAAECLGLPNNNLGVEYLRALRRHESAITPLTIPRRGAGHGEAAREGYASASYLRTLLRAGRWDDARPFLSEPGVELLRSAAFPDPALAERAFLYRLRQMSPDELAALPDCGEGLSNRLYQAIRQGSGLDDILARAKTKRYTHARLRRILTWAFLGLTAQDRPETPPYLRVLGMNATGQTLLRTMSKTSALPILTKPAHARRLSDAAQRFFALDVRATDLYGLCLPTVPPCGQEWLRGPVIL